MTSRLDRLFVLLEAGSGASGAATRRAAARQLGEVQKAHPEELHRLLGRLIKLLRSPAWETRIAAAQAVEAILSKVPEWHPPPYTGVKEEPDTEEPTLLKCETFDMAKILQHGDHLMGSEGLEYDMEEDLNADTKEQRLATQRQHLNESLGLDVASKLGVDLSGVYSNEDLCLSRPIPKTEAPRRPILDLVSLASKPLSSREMNLAKRKARLAFSKQKSRDCEEGPSTPTTPPVEPERKKLKIEPQDESFVFDSSLPVPDWSGEWGASSRWPLHAWCNALAAMLLSPAWEARHGAASALRETLRAKVADTAGCGDGKKDQEEAHQDWLEDMALRLLCVLALDRFGDFVSDQVVAPVRETCAQTLGVVLSQLSAPRVRSVAALLAQLARQPQWEARHGALLAYKYLLAAREDIACECGAIEHLLLGLEDGAEDVSAVAAGALAPAAAALARARPRALPPVARRLWRLLQDQDELASPANSYMALLASLMALPEAAKVLHPIDLADVLPRLWPYLDHYTTSVRKATLQTLRTLTRPLITNEMDKHNVMDKHNEMDKHNDVDKPNEIDNANELDKPNEMDKPNGATNGEEPPTLEPTKYLMWTPELLQDTMRHVYQRILFEHVPDIQDVAVQVWENLLRHSSLGVTLVAACPMLARWLCLAMQPARLAVEPSLLIHAPPKERRTRTVSPESGEPRPSPRWHVGGTGAPGDVSRARHLAAQLLGYLSCYLVKPAPGIEYKPEDESPIDCYVKVMVVYLVSGSALQRLVGSLVIAAWACREVQMLHEAEGKLKNGIVKHEENGTRSQEENGEVTQENGEGNRVNKIGDEAAEKRLSELCTPLLTRTLHTALNQALYYDEVGLNCNRILQEARDLLAMMKHYKLPVDGEEFNNIVRLEQVLHMTTVTQPMVSAMKSKRIAQTLEERRKSLHSAVTQCSLEQSTWNVSVQAAIAGAVSSLHCLPEKLNPVIRPLMESIKREPSAELQQHSATALAGLLAQLAGREPCPNNKVLNNLKAFLRCDPEYTPRVNLENSDENSDSASDSGAESKAELDLGHGPPIDKHSGILTLREQTRGLGKETPRRGRPPSSAKLAALDLASQQDEATKQLQIQRRGATLALTALTRYFGEELPRKLPRLWEFITEPLAKVMSDAELESLDFESAEELISRLQVIEVVASAVSVSLSRSHCVAACVALSRSHYTAVRHMAARALAALAARDPHPVMHVVLTNLVTSLGDMTSERVRCGAAETLWRCVDALQLRVVPYIVLLLVPLLGRMSDPCESVRLMSTRCFATLIQLMPLDGATPEVQNLTPEMQTKRLNDQVFLEQLFNPKCIKDYKIPVPVCAQLRSYQQAGVNWLRFLHDYKLHGVLCDDMGLGKTLQSIVVVAGSHYEQALTAAPSLPSLVVCPPTLTGHWVFEVNKFIPSKFLKPLPYVGPPVERERLRSIAKDYNLIVASYDIVRKDIDFFSGIKWNYCILDEGHVIKNVKTKAFKAIKQIVANHRLILSGTPIQNNVLELWSLFDFLMPGLLGPARHFSAAYSRPILQAREPRAAATALQAGARAVEALHRQVLPFILRRVKEDVLQELPPKITQDYYCELSPLQRRLYAQLSHAPLQARPGKEHVFQALHYLQNVCNHPKLVLTADHPETARIEQSLRAQNSSLDDIEHSAKLPALKQLLLDCGIGTNSESDTVVSQHRALIFCQLKKMLDIVERDLLQRHLPNATYLRLDGAVPPQHRHALVARFNSDVSIDVLLSTTNVGGLGLNLTGADTVIFVEHDWNPMKDLQAMDRAHRIGQKRVVNVYRLITRDTLEEKIMGLQKFKLQTANTVISSENAAIETMGTDQLLDLFQLSTNQQTDQPQPGCSGAASVLETLPDLWDDKQYEEEYDMTSFIKGLNKMNA